MSQELRLSQNKVAILDDEDFARLSAFRWSYRPERNSGQGYATRHGSKTERYRTIYLHREVVKPGPDQEVVFRNFDRLDCRRENLLVVTKEEARRHHRARKDSSSGLKGISYNDGPKTWSVDIYRNRTCRRVGTFRTKQEAIQAHEAALWEEKSNPDPATETREDPDPIQQAENAREQSPHEVG